MPTFSSFSGRLISIGDFLTSNDDTSGCYKIMELQNRNGDIVNFIVSPSTYFINHVTLEVGNQVIGFYDSDAPTPMIYPPQYAAYVMAIATGNQGIKVDFFNEQLISSDSTLKLNLSPRTKILLENSQTFTQSLENRYLIVAYGATTRSIPAQTTPYQIVVMCI